jgi:23S rRNA pseudouridine1911/1915/1917 synthase
MPLPRVRWIAGANDVLGALLERLAETSELEAGRVFVDGRRATDPTLALSAGATVEIFAAPRALEVDAIEVLQRADDLIWVNKPAGIPTEPDQRGTTHSLVARVSEQLGLPLAEIHALSRLDSGVSGVVMLSTSSDASRRINELRVEGALRRRYVAIAHAPNALGSGTWSEAVGRASPRGRRAVGGELARAAETRFSAVAVAGEAQLLALEPTTGRTHQLRVHASAHGAPFYGDRLYGGPQRLTDAAGRVRELERIALHAAWVRLPTLCVASEPAPEIVRLWRELGGDVQSFDLALAESLLVE